VLALEQLGVAPHLLAQLEEMAGDQFDDLAGTVASADAVDATDYAAPAIAQSLASAAAWLPWDLVGTRVLAWAQSPEPVLRRCALSALALQRLPAGDALARWLQDPHPMVRARALRAVGELGRTDLAGELGVVLHGAAEADVWACRSAAALSQCLLGQAHGHAEPIFRFTQQGHESPGHQDLQLVAAWAQTVIPPFLAVAKSGAKRPMPIVALG